MNKEQNMNIEQERAEFEAWYRLHHGSRDVYGRDASGEYADKQVQSAFNVWQARAALAAQPAASAEPVATGNATEPDWLQRLRIEARDLSDRLDRLSRFRDTAGFRMLTETDQALLDRQGNQMHALVQTMNQRIHSGAAQHMRSKSHD